MTAQQRLDGSLLLQRREAETRATQERALVSGMLRLTEGCVDRYEWDGKSRADLVRSLR